MCVCVCVCVCVSGCGCGCVCVCVWNAWKLDLLTSGSVQVSPMAHTCVLCVCESEIVCVCVCVNLKSDQACGWQAGFERRVEGSY